MSALNLVPNPTLVITQTAIFIANMIVVKKFLLNPYLELQKKRSALTTGNADLAKAIEDECQNISIVIDRRIQGVLTDVQDKHARKKEHATKEKDAILAKAKEQASVFLNGKRSQLKSDVVRERGKISSVAKSISDDVFTSLVRT